MSEGAVKGGGADFLIKEEALSVMQMKEPDNGVCEEPVTSGRQGTMQIWWLLKLSLLFWQPTDDG